MNPAKLIVVGTLLALTTGGCRGDGLRPEPKTPAATASSSPEKATPKPAADAPPPPKPPSIKPIGQDKPVFSSTIAPLSDEQRAAMTGVTWKPGCPVSLDELSAITATHWTYDDTVQEGVVIVATAHAQGVSDVLARLFETHFPIAKMAPAHLYGGDDNKLMAANVTHAFNCRKKTNGTSYSEHSFGHAIDINQVQNPYVKGGQVFPSTGEANATERSADVRGLITEDGPVVDAFAGIGWKWGGHWRSLKDYQHFSATGK